ncbi:MAG: hypothetical protein ACI8SK_000404 [Shewanella sp.]|jgi:hypothetical protein
MHFDEFWCVGVCRLTFRDNGKCVVPAKAKVIVEVSGDLYIGSTPKNVARNTEYYRLHDIIILSLVAG